jgi:hypothetical protein
MLQAVLPALLNTKSGSLGGPEENGEEVKVWSTGISGVMQEQGVVLNENFSFNLRGLCPLHILVFSDFRVQRRQEIFQGVWNRQKVTSRYLEV